MKKLIIIAGAAVLATAAQAGGSFIGSWTYGDNLLGNNGAYTGFGFTPAVGGYTSSNATKFIATRSGGTDTLLPGIGVPFMTFCAEVTEGIGWGGPQTHADVVALGSTTYSTINGGVVIDAAKATDLKKLWKYALSSVDFSVASNNYGFQLAQWNILFDSTPDWDLNSTGWYVTSGDLASRTAGQNMLTAASSITNVGTTSLYLMRGAGIQDQIAGFLAPPGGNTVPEPFTMGLGVAAAGVFVRRRMKAKKA